MSDRIRKATLHSGNEDSDERPNKEGSSALGKIRAVINTESPNTTKKTYTLPARSIYVFLYMNP
ncbi:hypothetical protein ACFSBH_01115 [Oceanobacillus luteolus]|uniref:Uncharacterized protein n=2 Tax=Oceanobacillus luteolus TaxID=1274358 RepID=A0ABW4HM51_9BACI